MAPPRAGAAEGVRESSSHSSVPPSSEAAELKDVHLGPHKVLTLLGDCSLWWVCPHAGALWAPTVRVAQQVRTSGKEWTVGLSQGETWRAGVGGGEPAARARPLPQHRHGTCL